LLYAGELFLMKIETQKLIIEQMLSSSVVFSRCIPIVKPEYFDPEVRPLIKFINSYYTNYNAVPKIDYINAEFELELKPRKLDSSEVQFTCDTIQDFCKQGALFKAIVDSAEDVTSGKVENYGKVLERVQKALAVAIQTELGINVYENIEKRLETYMQTDIYEPTGINGIDDPLGGGLARKQVTMLSANSGGGKSIMMSNIGANYSRRGFHVLQLALELTEQMIDLRNISILTGVSTSDWKSNIAEIAGTLKAHKEAGAGSFIIKRIPNGSSANDIRSYLKLYETEYGYLPDVLIVDYLDLMSPNGGTKDKSVFEQDKDKTEQLAQVAYDYNLICLTASQQNRDGLKTSTPDQSIIAGGISKINTVDNYISIYMNPEMRLRGEMFIYFLKTRSSSAVGSMSQLAFNPDNLIISDTKTATVSVINAIKNRANKKNEPIIFPGTEGDVQVPDEYVDDIYVYHETIDEDKVATECKSIVVDIEDDEQLWGKKKKFKVTNDEESDELLDLMGTL
jgi:DnaB-like helicase C terminal domain